MLLPLSQLPASLLPALAALHQATMPTLLSDLGDNFVLRYYQIAQKDQSVIALCLFSNQQSPIINHQSPIAYALGSPDPAALNAQLRQPLTWFAVQMLKLAFTRPGVLLQLAQSVITTSEANRLQPGQIELTYIGVAPEVRGRGLGKAVLAAFVEAARDAGYTSVALSVEIDNPAAIALYTNFGFTITQTFSEGRYHRYRMQFDL